MKVSEMFARAAALVSGKEPSTRAEVEAALRDCEARAVTAAAELEKLAPRRAELLVSGTDAEVAKHDADVSRISLERDRAAAIAAKLKERLAVIVAEEAAAERDRRRSEVELQAELAVEALRTRYPKAAAEVLAVLRTVAAASSAIATFAREYPSEPLIVDPERVVRTPTAIADEVISDRVVYCWVYEDGRPLGEHEYLAVVGCRPKRDADRVVPGIAKPVEVNAYRDIAGGPFECRGQPVHMARRRRREIKRTSRPHAPPSLFQTICLPGLLPTDRGLMLNDGRHVHSSKDQLLVEVEQHCKPRQLYGQTVVEYLPA